MSGTRRARRKRLYFITEAPTLRWVGVFPGTAYLSKCQYSRVRRSRMQENTYKVGKVVQPNRVGLLVVLAVLLIVDRNAIPISRGWGFVVVQRHGRAVQRNRLEQKVIGGGPLHLNDQVVPRVVHGIAGDPGRMP